MVDNDVVYKIRGAVYAVSNTLGCGFLEKVYEKALVYELTNIGFDAKPQQEIRIMYKGVDLGLQYFADIVIDDSIILELKAVKQLLPEHKAQLINYLRATGIEFGILINFGKPRVEIELVSHHIEDRFLQ